MAVLAPFTALACAGPVLASQFAAHFHTRSCDDHLFAYFGWRIWHGATVYTDVWDNKPPGIYWLNALLMGLGDYPGVIVGCAAAVIISLVLIFAIAARIYDRETAALTTILSGVFLTHPLFEFGSNRTETFLVVCELAGVATFLAAWRRPAAWRFLLAGVLCGAAFMFKQVGLAAWGALGLHVIVCGFVGRISWRAALARCLALACGLLLICGVVCAILAARGALYAGLFATFGFNAAYFADGDSNLAGDDAALRIFWNNLAPVLRLPLLLALSALLYASLWPFRPRTAPTIESRGGVPLILPLLFVWCLVAIWGATISPGHYRHYLIPALPPLLLITGYIVHIVKSEAGLLRGLARRGWALVALVVAGYFSMDAFNRAVASFERVVTARELHWCSGRFLLRQSDWEVVGETLAQLTKPDDRVWCDGYAPTAYLTARRINACRFPTTEKLQQVGDRATFIRVELESCLATDPPAIIGIVGGVAAALDPRDIQTDSQRGRFRLWLATFLKARYEPALEIEQHNFAFFRLKDAVAPHGSAGRTNTEPPSPAAAP